MADVVSEGRRLLAFGHGRGDVMEANVSLASFFFRHGAALLDCAEALRGIDVYVQDGVYHISGSEADAVRAALARLEGDTE